MAAQDSPRDGNFVPATLFQISGAARGQLQPGQIDQTTGRILMDTASGTGTVTSVSVVSANGFAGTVATATTTPAITLSTTITGLLKGNATAISAAVAGTDYQAPITLTTTGSSGAATLVGNTLNIPNYGSTGVSLTVGTTTIASGTTTKVLFDNAGVLGEYTISGSGSVAMTTSPVFTTPSLGAATATTINGNTFTTGSYTITGTAAKTLTFQNSITLAGTDATTMTFPSTSATIARTDAGQTFTGTQVFTSPTINGLPTGTGVASAATASTLVARDANANETSNNFIEGFTTTATAAGTTTMTVTSTYTQIWTGSSTQTVKLPTTGVAQGQQYLIINQSTGAVTVQSSGANTITILAGGTSAQFTAVVATPTTAANWSSLYYGDIIASGKSLTVSNTLTLAGTDATTMTFPTTSKTIAANDGSNWTIASQAIGDIAVATSTTAYGRLAAVATGSVLVSAGTGTAPAYSANPRVTTIELGAATDNTLARVAAGITSIEGETINGFATTATAAGTTTLTITAAKIQYFTGSSTQTVKLPTTSVVVGQSYIIKNASTGSVTVQSSGANTILVLGAGMSATFIAQVATPTTAANWDFLQVPYQGMNLATTASANAATANIAYVTNTITNNSAATITITMPTAGAVDGEIRVVRILDASAVAQTITWVNTENGAVSAPTTSNGSTTLPISACFQYNANTSKWRCTASA